MKTPCKICSTSCVSCVGKCKCWLNKSQVLLSNQIIEEENLLGNAEVLERIKVLMKSSTNKEYVKKEMYNKEAVAPKKEIVINVPKGYCEFPAGSVGKWKRIECIHCHKPRFQTAGKMCEAL